MDFRTQIDIPNRRRADTPSPSIDHDGHIVMLGSCFTDNVGERLDLCGFDVVHNPMGTLYNPSSILSAMRFACLPDTRADLCIRQHVDGLYHCLDFATKYTDASLPQLMATLNADLDELAASLRRAKTVIITLGTAYVFALAGSNRIVGNCHKFTPDTFTRYRLTVDDITEALCAMVEMVPQADVIFTVSPIRHTADGLHGNQLSKALLQLGIDAVIDMPRVHYFPAYEIMLDDLRDYRFYAEDMKHPSAVAVEYIFEVFGKYYFSDKTLERASIARRDSRRLAHRQILR